MAMCKNNCSRNVCQTVEMLFMRQDQPADTMDPIKVPIISQIMSDMMTDAQC